MSNRSGSEKPTRLEGDYVGNPAEHTRTSPLINDRKTVNSSSQHESCVGKENQDLMSVVARRRRGLSRAD